MSIEYEDITGSVYQAILDKQAGGEPLNGVKIYFPGEDYSTSTVSSWAVPVVEFGIKTEKLHGGNGRLTFLLFCRINSTKAAFAREVLAGKMRRAFQDLTFSLKNHQTGDGSTTIGLLRFRESGLTLIGLHDADGIYRGTWTIEFGLLEK